MTKPKKTYDLEERLIKFSLQAIQVSKSIVKTNAGYNLSNQLVRSGSSTALNYGEAQAAESRKDFIHKLRIVQKELRETRVCLTMLQRGELVTNESLCQKTKKECSELIAIITSSIKTTQKGLGDL